MAIKDVDIKENNDRDNKAQNDWESHHTNGDRFPAEAKGIAETEVKNAHATGDGSYGRSDESIPDETKADEREDNTY